MNISAEEVIDNTMNEDDLDETLKKSEDLKKGPCQSSEQCEAKAKKRFNEEIYKEYALYENCDKIGN